MSIMDMDFSSAEEVSFQTSNFESGLNGIDLQAPESMITEAFSSMATVFDNAGQEMEVAVTPSQLFKGGKMAATAENAAAAGFKVK